jgi:hypothetical protein
MNATLNFPHKRNTTGATPAQPDAPLAVPRGEIVMKPTVPTSDTIMLAINHVPGAWSSGRPANRLTGASLRNEALAARRRFFAGHGPGADMPRRLAGSKELRKALVAAEMALWESFQR